MSVETPPPQPKAGFHQLAPQWIVAIATLIVALTGAGFFAGRVTAQTPSGSAQSPTSLAPATSAAPTSAAPTSEPPTVAPTGPANGTQVGAYSFTIVVDYSVPLRDSAPIQSDFVPNKGDTDLLYSHGVGFGARFEPVSAANKIYGLKGNVAPTYAGCKSTTLFISSVLAVKGATFCISAPGRMFGVTVKSMSSQFPAPVTLSVISWVDTPS